MKYQSKVNSTWFIGFDELGNPISAQAPARVAPNVGQLSSSAAAAAAPLSGQRARGPGAVSGGVSAAAAGAAERKRGLSRKHVNAIVSERCYQFAKINRLTTSTQFFPEALELIERDQMALDANGDTSAHINATQEAARVFEEAQKALLARRRAAGHRSPALMVHAFNQHQIFNMTRFKNILRYQLGRSANQSILPEESGELWAAAGQGSASVPAAGKTRQPGVSGNKAGDNRRLANKV